MKNFKLLLIAILLPIASLVAQIPQAMKYQTVIRNASGEPLANTNVGLRLTIVEDGQDVYEETYDINTDARGLVSLNLGQGNTSDSFSGIAWDTNDYALEVEVDTNGGTNYQFVGSSTLLSVPFAMTAQTALDVDDADADPTNELQTLNLSGNTLSITNGNSVTLPSGGGSIDDEQLVSCWGRVQITGNVSIAFDTYNVNTVNKITTGVYVVSLQPGLFSTATNPSVVATVINDLSPGFVIPTYSASPSQITFRTYNASGVLSDRAFSFNVFGK